MCAQNNIYKANSRMGNVNIKFKVLVYQVLNVRLHSTQKWNSFNYAIIC